uniref:tetratricopeptide repeat protein n=1 Tax=Ningiella ruwaisensis TaxID=2364274 RepID=UPI0010A041C8|nr:tetratricopeptide repeat protein [Ningiella ruwaisensis]
MSVVNKMLQDLESRQAKATISADYIPPSIEKKSQAWLVVGAACLVSAGILFANLLPGEEKKTSSPFVNTSAKLAVPAPPDEDLNDKSIKENRYSSNSDTAVLKAKLEEKAPDILQTQAQGQAKEQTALMTKKEATEGPDSNPKIPEKTSIAQADTSQIYLKEGAESLSLARSQSKDNKASETDSIEPASFSFSPSSGVGQTVASLREKARLALANDNTGAAIASLEQLIRDFPSQAKERKQLASLLFSEQLFERAKQVLQSGIALNASDSSFYVMLARLSFKVGDYQSAYDALRTYPHENLADVELLSFRAALAERLSDYEKALHDYRLLVAREPENAKWWLGLGVSQDKLSFSEGALDAYQQVKALNQLPIQVLDFVEQRIDVLRSHSS